MIWPGPAGPTSRGDGQEQLRLLNWFGSALAGAANPRAARAIATLARTFVITWGDLAGVLQLECKWRRHKVQPVVLRWQRSAAFMAIWYPGRVRV